MARLLSTKPFSLPLVLPGEELSGSGPAALERAASAAKPGDELHRGLVFLGIALAEHGISATLAPAARPSVAAGLSAAEAWARGQLDAAAVRKARSEVFTAAVLAERQTVDALRAALEASHAEPHTALDAHANRVVLRYVGLAAAHALGAVLLVLDGVDDATRLVPIAQQVAGSIAYHVVGLGPARSGKLRAAACEHAEWESHRTAAHHDATALAVQLFHEFLGAAWKDHGDARRAALFDFVTWALGQ